jgi:hypothetical protein
LSIEKIKSIGLFYKDMNYESTVPKLSRILRNVSRDHQAFSQATVNPFDYFDEVKKEPLSADELYTGFTIARILRHEPTVTPLTLQKIVQQVNRYYPELGEHDVNFLQTQFQQQFAKDYTEQKIELIIEYVKSKRARVIVSSGKSEQFKTSLPSSYFERKPNAGDKYTGVVWDLFQHWFGISNLTYNGSAIPEWTPEKRAKFIESLNKIKFGTQVEREGRKKK